MKSPSSFIAITSEGGLLPADFLHELPDPKTTIEGVTPVAYHLAEGERLNEQINRSWNRLKGCWENFKKAVAEKPVGEATTTDTRERWLLPLFQELGFGRVTTAKPIEVDGRSYPVSHGWNQVPIHLVGSHADLDLRTPGAVGAAKASPHSLVQSALNASEAHLWGIASNGFNLRLLRDNVALTRLAYVEFDLQAMFDGDLYSEFFVLWLVCHQSRFEGGNLEEGASPMVAHRKVWLERWKKSAEDKSLRALDDLYPGVKKAIAALGSGLVSHPGNTALREKLRTGKLTTQEFYRQVLRVIYRMLFQLVAEDRALLHVPDESEAALKARRRYLDFYSIARLRSLTLYRSGTPHPDLWHVFQFVTAKLGSDTGCPELALPPLGSFLWSASQSTPDLLDSLISNRHFLEAVHAIAFVQDGNVRRAVDYKNLGSEELGSVYQGLLEMHPRINADAGSFELDTAAGNERKTSGSYYTPDSLVQCLLDSALEPVIAETIEKVRSSRRKEAPSSKSAIGNRQSKMDQSLVTSAATEAEAIAAALLSLKVCDMAAGSGHFIIRAGHRIARHLARVRSGEEEPSPRVYQTALRDVIGHCLYGVDINPMAVELCKVTLWLEALEPGKPLSFLDHHIRCGNSLLGATPELIAAGLPDDAFEAIEGDDKAACASLKKLNRAQREGLRHMFIAEDTAIRERLHQAAAAIDEISDSQPEDIHRKEAAFRSAQTNYDFGKAWDLANLWCAAFVIKKHFAGGAIASGAATVAASAESATLNEQPLAMQGGLFGGTEELPKTKGKKAKASSHASSEIPIGITTQNLRDFVEGGVLPDGLVAESKRLADQFQFFHFHLAFPEVSAQGGFDALLGNPPWEEIRPEEKNFFATLAPDIAGIENRAKRKAAIARLETDNPVVYAAWGTYCREILASCHFLHSSGFFPDSAVGNLNTHTLFFDLFRQSLNTSGRAGLVVPSGLATNEGTSALFGSVMGAGRLRRFLDFENRNGFFPAIDSRTRFSLVTLSGSAAENAASEFGFFLLEVADLVNPERVFPLTSADLEAVNPNTLTCPTFRTRCSAELVKSIHKQFRIIMPDHEVGEWKATSSRMFDMSYESGDFVTQKVDGTVPLYEGKMVAQFNHRAAAVVINASNAARQAQSSTSTIDQLQDAAFSPNPQYWVPTVLVEEKISDKSRSPWLLNFCGVTSPTNERTCITAITPRAGAGNSLLQIYGDFTAAEACCLLANFDSFALDYVLREKMGGLNLNHFIFRQLPVVSRTTYGKPCTWAGQTSVTLRNWLLPRVLELTYTAWDLEAFAQDCGWSGPPFRWDEERRFLLRCELDAAFFHLYLGPETEWRQQPAALTHAFPTPRAAVAYILDTFPIVKRKDEAKFNGDYRTKRVILEIYDALAAAMQTGQPYQTHLDPPPADARCCHPPKARGTI